MSGFFAFLADNPLLLLGIFIIIGGSAGKLAIGPVTLGPIAVLLAAIALTAWGTVYDQTLQIPEVLGNLGLAIFAFATGLLAGPSFFAALRSSWTLMLAVVLVLIVAAGVGIGVGGLFELPGDAIAGTFAGALNNTPALAAAGSTPAATVGYAVAYLFGLVAMLGLTQVALSRGPADRDDPEPLVTATVRIDTSEPTTIRDLHRRFGRTIAFTRVSRSSTDPVLGVDDDTVLGPADLLTVVGPENLVEQVISDLGHRSSHDLVASRADLDFRRITISDPRLAGRRVADLRLEQRFEATIARIRRGDTDFISTPGERLQLGDRVRVVAPPEKIDEVTRYLGDSARGLSDINPVALGGGLALGLGLGLIQVPVPGLGALSVGAAAGTLMVGLVMGRVGRIGPVHVSMPHTAATVLVELGLLIFLSFAGTRAGSQILEAFTDGAALDYFVTGALVTLVAGLGVLLVVGRLFRAGRTRLGGIVAGAQTQPALLAFANNRTCFDPRVAIGYALVYPAAMIVKVVLAQIMAGG
ncbi:hypothetical protein GOHSU_04_01840 [Gordonia hirsuta DSM 44140 = NBRC 16056]|uniref:RCK C-terminal domain-containing protein n=1 Tax=Gordonia hirsuta DSM 44140 = NBRC 16056 TaxID=1121927 RepID=L7L5U2_9ACTN|nr:TrkA C-terminal domain-containing protein [Gordonia hirsuta]GAC56314.1 hypothetical protein GOHSU_04_01840 [Gordonia hirsuta DSM 44140 = NBRC 16056]